MNKEKHFDQIFRLSLGIILVFIAGCATSGRLSYDQQELKPIVFDETKGYIYFYRPCMFFGAARGVTVSDSQRMICGLNCSTYFIHEVEPGTYSFHADDWLRKEQVLTLDVKPGQEYFVKADLKIGIIDAVPSLTLMDASAKEIVTKLKRVPVY